MIYGHFYVPISYYALAVSRSLLLFLFFRLFPVLVRFVHAAIFRCFTAIFVHRRLIRSAPIRKPQMPKRKPIKMICGCFRLRTIRQCGCQTGALSNDMTQSVAVACLSMAARCPRRCPNKSNIRENTCRITCSNALLVAMLASPVAFHLARCGGSSCAG